MLRNKVWSFLAVAVAFSGGAAYGDSIAGAILQELGAGPQVLAFDDDTRVVTFDDGGDGTLDVGDRIQAQLIFRNVNQVLGSKTVTLGGVDVVPPTPVNELTGYVELEVTGKTVDPTTGQFRFDFGAWSSGGTITALANNPNAVMAIYEDSAQNGILSGMPIPDPTMVDGQLWAVLGLQGPGQTVFNLETDLQADGIHHDESSAAGVPASDTLGQGNLRLNRIDMGGAAITDASNGEYAFGPNTFGTEFAGTFDYFGGGGTGADFTAAMELRSTVTIIPLPPAFLAAMPGMALMAFVSYRRRRLA
jgi:hypothetical protein